jgi:hypothetical protein
VHRIIWILLLVAFLFGSPYAAMMLFSAMGPWDAVMVEQDGKLWHLREDANMAAPEFVPIFPGSRVVQAGLMTTAGSAGGIGHMDLAARGTAEQVREFYISRLRAAGFDARDLEIPGLNPMTAAYLGLAGSVVGKRPATDDIITVQIRTEEGWFVPSRLLQISWRKISEWPTGQPVP